jgi:hypothetical protein
MKTKYCQNGGVADNLDEAKATFRRTLSMAQHIEYPCAGTTCGIRPKFRRIAAAALS